MAIGTVFIIDITIGQRRAISLPYWQSYKKDGDHEWHILDGSIIKVHQDAMRSSYDKSLEAIGRSVGGLSTKIHAKVDALGQYDKTARMYLTGVMFVSILLALK